MFQFNITRDDSSVMHWTLDMKHGSGSVYQGTPTDGVSANTVLTMSEATLSKWLAQETDPVTALMTGDLTVTGDHTFAIKLAVLQPVVREATATVNQVTRTAFL